MNKSWLKLLLTLKILIAPIYLNAEPFVVLSYNNSSELSGRDNPFSLDPDYSIKHTVLSGETLNVIINKYYNSSGLNMSFLQLAIVSLNKHAFRNKNINYMIADQTIHLPSVNQISKLMKGIDFELDAVTDNRNENIYFYGG
tara:strand:+ start:120 stop:545 length:426 start_codon:yes stop_codon:yes gene_type:complete